MVQQYMQFSIATILIAAVYVALAFASLVYPTIWMVLVVRTMLYLTIAMATIVAFDRRSTPLFSFAVFAVFACANFEIAASIVLYLMTELGVKTGSNEFAYFKELLFCHFVFVVAVVGFAVGNCVKFWSIRRETGTRSATLPDNGQ